MVSRGGSAGGEAHFARAWITDDDGCSIPPEEQDRRALMAKLDRIIELLENLTDDA